MEWNKKTSQGLAIWGIVFFMALGCQTTQEWKWWEEPPREELKVKGFVASFVGSASVNTSFGQTRIEQAREAAQANARQAIGSYMGVKVQSLALDWSKEMGNVLDKNSMVTLMQSAEISRYVVRQSVSGAIPLRFFYDKDSKTYYCLMGLRAPDFLSKFKEVVVQKIEQVIPEKKKTLSMEELDKLKDQARKRLDELSRKTQQTIEQKAKRELNLKNK